VLLASLGLFQFVTNQSWVDRLTIPGLTVNNGLFGVQEREGFTRPAGTAIHPIEFGVVLAMLLPLVLARAGLATQELERTSLQLRRWGAAMVVAAAIALSSSRSAFVCAAVGVAMVLPRLDRRARWVVASGAGVLAVFVFVMVPGMLGSMLGLFTGIETDTSALSRVDSYGVALTFLARAPVLGRGFATFSPSYRIFDNQYLLSAVELGLVGVGLLVALFLGAIVVGSRVARTNTHNRLGLLSQGLVGGVATGATGFALFDALSFPMVPGLLFMLIGLVGACGQIAGDRDLVPERAGTSSVVQPPQASVVER
jgi:O-antigen ligase